MVQVKGTNIATQADAKKCFCGLIERSNYSLIQTDMQIPPLLLTTSQLIKDFTGCDFLKRCPLYEFLGLPERKYFE